MPNFTLRIRRRWLGLIVALSFLLGIFICWQIVGVTINIPPQRPIDQLMAARSKWQTRNLTSYTMWIQVSSFSMIGAFKITVQDNQVTDVQNGNLRMCDTCLLTPLDATATDYQAAFGRFYPPTLQDITMDNLFAFAADKLKDVPAPPIIAMCSTADTAAWRYEATYDPDQGYITTLRYTNCPRSNALMCPVVSHCNTQITVANIQPH